jgi:cobalt-zinc-cadmium efflux system protein
MPGHAHAHRVDAARARHKGALLAALAVNLAYTAGEAIAGFATGSLALLADAGHNLSDVFVLGIALAAAWLASRPSTPQRSFGFQRAEILSALGNGLSLVVVGVWILVEAAGRFGAPPDLPGGWIVGVAAAGIAVNAASTLALLRVQADSLNIRAAGLHLAGDAVASAGVVVAGTVILAFGWRAADPAVGILIALLVLGSSWSDLRESLRILLEMTPAGIDATEVGRRMAGVPGVVEVHDLHIWTITSGFPALSAHVLVPPGDECHVRRRELEELLAREFGIEHTTLQVDHAHEGELLQLGRFLERRNTP